MDFVRGITGVFMLLFIIMVFTIIYMAIANYVGEQLGFGKLFRYIYGKINRK